MTVHECCARRHEQVRDVRQGVESNRKQAAAVGIADVSVQSKQIGSVEFDLLAELVRTKLTTLLHYSAALECGRW